MPHSTKRHLQVEVVEDVAIVKFLDAEIREVFGEHMDVQEIGDQLYALVDDNNYNRLVLDFREVQFMASIMLGKLIGLKRKLQKLGGGIKLCRLRPVIREVFYVSALDRVFEIYDDEHSALDAFADGRS